MNKKLKQRIKEFNKIKYPNDKSNRIIIASLKPDIPVMGSFDEDGNQTWGVTTAPNNK